MVKKYFASSNRFLEAYQQEGCDGDNVKVYERELKKIELLKKPKKVHRGAVITSDDEDHDNEAPKIKRNKFKNFLKNFVAIPGTEHGTTETIPPAAAEAASNYNEINLVAIPAAYPAAPLVPMEVTAEANSSYNDINLVAIGEEVEDDLGLEEFAEASEEFANALDEIRFV